MIAALLLAAAVVAAPIDPLAEVRGLIDRVDADWLPAMQAKDAQRIAEAYAADGVFVLADGKAVVGHDAVVELYRARFAGLDKVLDGGIVRDGLAAGPDGLVYEWGHGGATTIDKTGKRSSRIGPYLTVWKRQAEGPEKGHWRIIRNLVF